MRDSRRPAPHPQPSPKAGGAFIALLTLAGALIGGFGFGQPTIGLLLGLAAGIGVALAIWYKDRGAR